MLTGDACLGVLLIHGETKSAKFASQTLSHNVHPTHGLTIAPTYARKPVHQLPALTGTMSQEDV